MWHSVAIIANKRWSYAAELSTLLVCSSERLSPSPLCVCAWQKQEKCFNKVAPVVLPTEPSSNFKFSVK
uniref:Uncharacterized protein n=1 Tax=Populus trichocarpa TaxID=3694 RepID=A0A2K1XQU6_POPTR